MEVTARVSSPPNKQYPVTEAITIPVTAKPEKDVSVEVVEPGEEASLSAELSASQSVGASGSRHSNARQEKSASSHVHRQQSPPSQSHASELLESSQYPSPAVDSSPSQPESVDGVGLEGGVVFVAEVELEGIIGLGVVFVVEVELEGIIGLGAGTA